MLAVYIFVTATTNMIKSDVPRPTHNPRVLDGARTPKLHDVHKDKTMLQKGWQGIEENAVVIMACKALESHPPRSNKTRIPCV